MLGCVLTGGCPVAARDYPANGVVQDDARLVVLPRAVFEELMALVEAVAFHRLDRRLAATRRAAESR